MSKKQGTKAKAESEMDTQQERATAMTHKNHTAGTGNEERSGRQDRTRLAMAFATLPPQLATALKRNAIRTVVLTATVVMLAAVVGAALVSNANRASAQFSPGLIYLTNTGQGTTNLVGAPDSIDPLWATYAADIAGGEPLRLIDSDTNAQTQTPGDDSDADLLLVTVVDDGYNFIRTVESDPDDNLDLTDVFDVSSITVPGAISDPISGSIADIQVFLDDGSGPDGIINGDETQIAGPGASPVIATVISVNAAGTVLQVRAEVSNGEAENDILVRYQSSVIDTIEFGTDPDGGGPLPNAEIKATSDVSTTGQRLILAETGRDTSRFEGYLRLTDRDGHFNDGLEERDAIGNQFDHAAVLRVGTGPVTVQYTDSNGNPQLTQASIDTSAPVPAITSPPDGTPTQNQQPTIVGDVVEFGSGLSIDDIKLYIHEVAEVDPNANYIPAIAADGSLNSVAVSQPILKAGALDGDTFFSFSSVPPAPLPTGLEGVQPDHIVDLQIIAEDLAGNIGFSDSDNDPDEDGGTSGHGVTLPGHDGSFDAHLIKIDRAVLSLLNLFTSPVVSAGDHKTGRGLNVVGEEVTDRKSMRLRFTDDIDETSVDPSDFAIEYPSTGETTDTTLVVVDVAAKGPYVYVTMQDDIPPDERPIVRLRDDGVADKAGNLTSFGDTNVSDGISPTLTVTMSGGSGTGTGPEGPDQLTNDEMLITITSDEALTAPPHVEIYRNINAAAILEDNGPALSTGGNTWEFNYTGIGPDGDRAVVVDGIDMAASGSHLISDSNNLGTAGEDDERSFTLDSTFGSVIVTLSPEGSPGVATSLQPQVEFDFGAGGEVSTVTLTDIELDGVDILANMVVSGNGLVHTFVPTSDLSPGAHEIQINVLGATDAAGNQNSTDFVFQFTVDVPLALCTADVDASGTIEKNEAVDVVVSYLLGGGVWTRQEAIDVATAYLLATSVSC